MGVEGEAGVGYRIRYDFDLPPLMFDRHEILALILGSRMVQAWSDPELASAAGRALDKINAILPDDLKPLAEQHTFLVPNFLASSSLPEVTQTLRRAIEARHQMQLHYRREDGQTSERVIDPMGMIYWGGKWTLIAWCHLRSSYRQFRPDRIIQVSPLDRHFETSATHSMEHYMVLVRKAYEAKQS